MLREALLRMNCPGNRASWVLSAGGVSIRIHAENTAADIIQDLKGLFCGFVVPEPSAGIDAELVVTLDAGVSMQTTTDTVPVNLMKAYHPYKAKLIQKIRSVGHLSFADGDENLYLIGFQNGILSYQDHQGTAVCFLFQGNTKSQFLVGSLYKLTFVFLCLLMAAKDRFFIHSAAVQHDGAGYLFWGSSGAGKTTIAGFSARPDVFSDDAPILLKENNKFYCVASPFCQLEEMLKQPRKQMACVRENLFLNKSHGLKLTPKPRNEAFSEILFQHLHHFEFMSRDLRKRAFNFFYELCRQVPAYDLYFMKDSLVWPLIAGRGRKSASEG